MKQGVIFSGVATIDGAVQMLAQANAPSPVADGVVMYLAANGDLCARYPDGTIKVITSYNPPYTLYMPFTVASQFADKSASNRVFTNVAGAIIDTSVFPTGALKLNGSTQWLEYLNASCNADFSFAGDFDISMTLRCLGAGGTYTGVISTASTGSVTDGWIMEASPTRGLYFGSSTGAALAAPAVPVVDGANHDYRIRRVGTNLQMLWDGVVKATQVFAGNVGTFSGQVNIGLDRPFYTFEGFISNVIVNKP